MQRSTLTSRFLAGFTPSQMPPRGPNGMVPAPPPPDGARLPVIDPPSLCEAGPCRNYHRVASVMDSQYPVGGSGPAHRQITRACYPTAGIELELGETPVLQCSRWEPDNEQARLDSLRSQYMKTPDGKAFVEKVAAFEATLHDDYDDDQDDAAEGTVSL